MNATALPGFERIIDMVGVGGTQFLAIVIAVALIALILKGFALWHAARNYQRYWFVAILVINTFGLLELVYLLGFRKDKDENRTQSLFNTPAGPASSPAA